MITSMHQNLPLTSLKPHLIEKIKIIEKGKTCSDNFPEIKNLNNLKKYSVKQPSVKSKFNFWIEGYGCSASFSDMEMIAGKLKNDGFNLVSAPELADINLIVTCSVKMPTEHKMSERIKTLTKLDKPLIIAGCLPAADENIVTALNPKASLIGPKTIDSVTDIAEAALRGIRLKKISSTDNNKLNLPKMAINPIVSILQISAGCLSECTFCQTKLAKGTLKSFRIGDIINRINVDLNNGSKEIWLTSTDNGCYGFDLGTNIVNLVKSCEKIDKYFKIRLGMMNPMYLGSMTKGLEEVYESSEKLYKFIHVPIQSGSKSVLEKMKRGRSLEPLLDFIERLKNLVPNITVATDVITGFPTETDEDFEDTLNAILNLRPDIVNSSKFSPRPGTLAVAMPRINDEIISKRSEKLHRLIKRIAKENNERWLGWKGEVLINDIENGKMKGRNNSYKSIVFTEDPDCIFTKISSANSYSKLPESSKENDKFQYDVFSKNRLISSNPYMGKRVIAKVISTSNHTLLATPLKIVN